MAAFALSMIPARISFAAESAGAYPIVIFTSDVEVAALPVATSTVAILIHDDAQRYGVSEEQLYGTLWCESRFRSIQSQISNPSTPNGYEWSFGVAQINLHLHPDVTMGEALDARFSVDWAAQQFKAGRQSMWTCYRNLYQ